MHCVLGGGAGLAAWQATDIMIEVGTGARSAAGVRDRRRAWAGGVRRACLSISLQSVYSSAVLQVVEF